MFPKKILLKNNKNLTIREAVPKDAPQLIEYLENVFSQTDFLTRGPGEFNMSIEDEEKFIKNLSEEANKIFLVALIDKKIVSVLTFLGGDKIREKHVGEFGITVEKEFWGLGIASLMLTSLINWAKNTKIIRKLNLLVLASNEKAIYLYKKFGFEIEGTHTRDILINNEFQDAHFMGLKID